MFHQEQGRACVCAEGEIAVKCNVYLCSTRRAEVAVGGCRVWRVDSLKQTAPDRDGGGKLGGINLDIVKARSAFRTPLFCQQVPSERRIFLPNHARSQPNYCEPSTRSVTTRDTRDICPSWSASSCDNESETHVLPQSGPGNHYFVFPSLQ